VVFTHDTEEALRAAVALANSAEEPDTFTTTAELAAFLAAYRYTGHLAGDAAELEDVRGVRPLLRRLLTAERDETVALVNAVLADRRAVPQLVRHDGFDYHLHAVDPDTPLADRVAVETAMALIDLIRADELSRLATCADPACDGIVLDLSRNRSRRFCSTACGNRIAVANYRARRHD
jgi:predicted RNA-binding Zn ribbon-like protein